MDPELAKSLESLAARLREGTHASWLAAGALDPGSAFATEDLERLLYRSGAPVNLIRDGDRRNRVGTDELVEALPHGWTVQVEDAERHSEPLARLCGRLEELLGGDPVRVNLYYSPVTERPGFPTHHDTLDAFIVQVAGAKRWEVWERRIEHPIWMMRDHDQPVGDDPPRLEVTLRAGDVLFVRQGDPHRAAATEAPSLHLTVGLRRPVGHHLLRWLADQATDLAAVRAPAPLAEGLQDAGLDRISWARATIDAFVDHVRSEPAEAWLARYLDERAATRDVAPAAGLAGAPALSDRSRVRVSDPQLASRRDGGRLVFAHRVLRFPADLGVAVDALRADRQRWWTIGELAEEAGVDPARLRSLADALVGQGFLIARPD
jgi:bifunctional lysine-specific demethylase and histidyl-hydroxylase NO66